MKIVVNDLPFQYQFYSVNDAIDKLNVFIALCHDMKAGKLTNIEGVYLGERIDTELPIASGKNIKAMLQYILPREERGFLLSILSNSPVMEKIPKIPFEYNGISSYTCAAARNEILLSLLSDECFNKETLKGLIGGNPVEIKNIAKEEHVNAHGEELGKRIYKANDVKHKKGRFNNYGGGIASPMDLEGEEAQELLESAIEVKGRLYARRGKKNYSFQNERGMYYHGYIDETLGDDVIRELNKRKWK